MNSLLLQETMKVKGFRGGPYTAKFEGGHHGLYFQRLLGFRVSWAIFHFVANQWNNKLTNETIQVKSTNSKTALLHSVYVRTTTRNVVKNATECWTKLNHLATPRSKIKFYPIRTRARFVLLKPNNGGITLQRTKKNKSRWSHSVR